jgi:RNA polymerase sigma-70 factor, ECF subfamily
MAASEDVKVAPATPTPTPTPTPTTQPAADLASRAPLAARETAASAEPTADAVLMTALVGGDAEALATLFDRHAPLLLALAVRLLGDRARAQALVHDAFLEAWHKARNFDPARGSARAWLVTRTRALALERRAAAAAIGAPADQTPWQARDRGDGVAGPGDQTPPPLDRAPVRGREGASCLPPDLATVLEMAYFDDLSFAAIGETLHLPLGTVKARMARALSAVREGMGLARAPRDATESPTTTTSAIKGAP